MEQQKTQVDVLDLLRMVDHAANRGFKGVVPKREARVVLKGGHCSVQLKVAGFLHTDAHHGSGGIVLKSDLL